jgi:hypothetical protein
MVMDWGNNVGEKRLLIVIYVFEAQDFDIIIK